MGAWSNEQSFDLILLKRMFEDYYTNEGRKKDYVRDKSAWEKVQKWIPGKTDAKCRERWKNILDPKIDYSLFSKKDYDAVLAAVKKHGLRFSRIAEEFPRRRPGQIKTAWKKLVNGSKKLQALEKKLRENPPKPIPRQNLTAVIIKEEQTGYVLPDMVSRVGQKRKRRSTKKKNSGKKLKN